MPQPSALPEIPTLHVSTHPLVRHKRAWLSDVRISQRHGNSCRGSGRVAP